MSTQLRRYFISISILLIISICLLLLQVLVITNKSSELMSLHSQKYRLKQLGDLIRIKR